MNELFTDYKNAVRSSLETLSVNGVPLRITEEMESDFLRVARRLHANGTTSESAARVARRVFFAPLYVMFPGVEEFRFDGNGDVSPVDPSTRVSLTEAGEAALEMNDELKAIDSSLGLPPSSPSSAPPPPVDPCDDDVVKLQIATAVEESHELLVELANTHEDRPVDATHKQRKVPRR